MDCAEITVTDASPALFTTGENATSTGGVELKSLTQMAANVFRESMSRLDCSVA